MRKLPHSPSLPRLKIIWAGVALCWSLLIVVLGGWNYHQSYRATIEVARSAAFESYSKDLVYRRWATVHGGVYVPATPETPPNPYLSHISERDIRTPSGKRLTLMNPAYMTRQVHELGAKDYGTRGHITSLTPIRPQNAPDPWERQALQAFAEGRKELFAIEPIDGRRHFRFMRPMITEAGCLRCHARQGYRLGDIRGGISVSMPWDPFHGALQEQLQVTGLAYGLIWGVGMLGLSLGRRRLQHYLSDRQRAGEALRQSEERFRLAFATSPDAVNINRLDDGLYVDTNEGFTRLTGYTREEVIGRTSLEINLWYDAEDRRRLVEGLQAKGCVENLEAVFRRRDGSTTVALMSARRIDLYGVPHILSVTRDISERKRDEEERRQLQEQLLQAQKMESVGRLAGGVAHDFNNMLGVILGHAEMAMDQIEGEHPVRADLEQIEKAARRSADLTHQLLAFARKQTISPKILDLNETVEGTLKMLRRLIGEDIDLVWTPGAGLWSVRMDPSQINQILTNLCVNARDAIEGTGEIRIGTQNVAFGQDPFAGHADPPPGEYVCLTVNDSGRGMDAETMQRLFEPFFTTKPFGQGTGLGLATIYGIVKQNGGGVQVESQPGQGSTFKVFFPREARGVAPVSDTPVGELRGDETILVVEDEPHLLDLTRGMLVRQGYEVLAAATPGEAIRLAGTQGCKIRLLMTDVIMPEMNGQALAERIVALQPGIRCLFTSGYTDDVIARHGVLDAGTHFIQKPFSRKALAAKVREILDRV